MNRPHVIAKAAISLDGYLDDASGNRRVFSSAADLQAVDHLRADCDAILVGAGTLRADDPRLCLRDEKLREQRRQAGRPADPLKVTLTGSGALDPDARFFSEGEGQKLVYCVGGVCNNQTAIEAKAELKSLPNSDQPLTAVLADLAGRGVKRLLIEGGAKVFQQLFAEQCIDEFRLAIAAVFIADSDAPRLCSSPFDLAAFLTLQSVEQLEQTTVLWFSKSG